MLDDDERHRRHDRRRGRRRATAGASRARRSSTRRRAPTSRSASRTAPAIRSTPSPRAAARRLDAAGHGHAGALVADLPSRHRLRRDLRGGAHPRRFPREARRRGAPDVQSRRDPRRHVGGFRRGPGARHGVRQDERRRRATRSWPAICATLSKEQLAHAQRDDAGDRRGDVAAAHEGDADVRRRLSAAGADRRQREAARASTTARAATSASAPVAAVSPDQRRRRRRLVRRRRGADDHRRHRPDGPRRSHAGRNRRPRDAAEPDQARGDPALPPAPGKK